MGCATEGALAAIAVQNVENRLRRDAVRIGEFIGPLSEGIAHHYSVGSYALQDEPAIRRRGDGCVGLPKFESLRTRRAFSQQNGWGSRVPPLYRGKKG